MRTMKHWALAAMAAAALALAGCGGGGNAPPQAAGPDPALVAAQGAAMAAATAADMAADAAEMAADAQMANMSADEANYALAQAAAMRARAAADMAQAASDAAAAAGNAAEAEKQRGIAETQQANAVAEQALAVTYAGMVAAAQQVIDRDIADATMAAETAAKAARASATAARQSATDARAKANAAKASYDMAVATRTDIDAAKKHYEAADAAADAAETAATAAETAATAAETAHTGIDAAGTAAAAEAAQMTAETEQDKAGTQAMTAATQSGNASTAADEASTAAGTHVLALFKAANPADDPETKDAEDATEITMNENANRVEAVTAKLMAAAGTPHSGGNQASGSSADITVTYDRMAAEDDPDTEGNDSAAMRKYTVSGVVGISSKDLEGDNPNAKSMDLVSLGGFTGIELSRNNTHVHIYTDIDPQQIEMTDTATVQLADVSSIKVADTGSVGTVMTDSDGTKSVTGTLKIAYDHDNDSNTDEPLPVPGTFTCPSGCTYTIEDGKFTAIAGFTFMPDPVMIGGTPFISDEGKDGDYLTFGVWLKTNDATGAMNGNVEAGAYSAGAMEYMLDDALTGTATYEGPAVGVKSMGGAVSHVDGTATLMADFGKPGENGAADTMPGSVSGSVDIGGMMVRLGESNLTDSGGFSGNASAGDAMGQDDATVVYPYTGMWGGSFYGASDDGAEMDAKSVMPSSAAGTFGVTGGEKDTAMSLIGSFGAHKQ